MAEKIPMDISEKTLERIAEFFLNTSVPRIIEERKKEIQNAS
ncbi:hypothetical protein [Ornithinibacillus xuwenensis]|uniref:Uncharacterized protein n=1 Tax=Ornithinibacillus xuwenensis TaxID=3144668 RepID=A0ABU9XCF7_9BACI